MPRKYRHLNARQLKVAAMYGGGEYANDKTEADVEEAGDTLYKYAVYEAEDAKDDAEYARRLATAIDDLMQLREAFKS